MCQEKKKGEDLLAHINSTIRSLVWKHPSRSIQETQLAFNACLLSSTRRLAQTPRDSLSLWWIGARLNKVDGSRYVALWSNPNYYHCSAELWAFLVSIPLHYEDKMSTSGVFCVPFHANYHLQSQQKLFSRHSPCTLYTAVHMLNSALKCEFVVIKF